MSQKRNKENQEPEFIDNDYLSSASATDCTGLIPAGITDEEELDYYEELYPFLPKAVKEGDRE